MNFAGPNRRGGHPLKYPLTEEIRAHLLALYDSTNRREIAAKFGVPPWVVSKWAGELGVRRTKEKPWTRDEIFYLEESIHRRGWRTIAKHLGRTVCAVKLKAKRLDLRKLDYTEGVTALQLSRLLGVDGHMPAKWVAQGKLRGRHRGSDRKAVQGGDAWLFTDENLRAFIVNHRELIDLRRVDRDWFIDLLSQPWQYEVRAA